MSKGKIAILVLCVALLSFFMFACSRAEKVAEEKTKPAVESTNRSAVLKWSVESDKIEDMGKEAKVRVTLLSISRIPLEQVPTESRELLSEEPKKIIDERNGMILRIEWKFENLSSKPTFVNPHLGWALAAYKGGKQLNLGETTRQGYNFSSEAEVWNFQAENIERGAIMLKGNETAAGTIIYYPVPGDIDELGVKVLGIDVDDEKEFKVSIGEID